MAKHNMAPPVGRFDKRSQAYERYMDNKSTKEHSYNHPIQEGKRKKSAKRKAQEAELRKHGYI